MTTTLADVEQSLSYSERRRALARRAGGLVAATFAGLAHLNREDIPVLIGESAAALIIFQQASNRLTEGIVGVLGGQPSGALPVAAPAWEDPFIATWKHLADGDDWVDARDAGIRRAEIVGHDAVIRTADEAVTTIDRANPRIVGWRRVVVAETCAWCRTVSTQRYRAQDSALRVRHNRCDCEVVPILADKDPGRVINLERRDAEPDSTAT